MFKLAYFIMLICDMVSLFYDWLNIAMVIAGTMRVLNGWSIVGPNGIQDGIDLWNWWDTK